MPVIVTTPEIMDDHYSDSRKYHIDEMGYLHVVGGTTLEGNIASYAPGCWSSVKVQQAGAAR